MLSPYQHRKLLFEKVTMFVHGHVGNDKRTIFIQFCSYDSLGVIIPTRRAEHFGAFLDSQPNRLSQF